MTRIIVLILIAIILISDASALVHWVCGSVADAADGTNAYHKEIRIYYDDADSYSPCTVGVESKYCCDAGAIPNLDWTIGDVVNLYIPDPGDNYYADAVSVVTTGEGFDTAPDLLLTSDLMILLPLNQTYRVNYTTLSIISKDSYSRAIWYDLDNKGNITICNVCTTAIRNLTGLGDTTHTVKAYAIDASNNIISKQRNFVIDAINDPPTVIMADDILTATENVLFTYDVNATDPDGDNVQFFTDSSLFTIDVDTGLINFTPGPSDGGNYTITISARDTANATGTKVILLEIIPVNDPPSIDDFYPATTPVTITEGETLTFSISKSDPDATTPTVKWYRNNSELAGEDGDYYTFRSGSQFSNPLGSYKIKAEISDGEFSVNQQWVLFVAEQESTSSTRQEIDPFTITVDNADDPELAITSLIITTNGETRNVGITLKRLDGKPSWLVMDDPNKIYQYIEIIHNNLTSDEIDQVKIRFTVEKAWLESNNFDPSIVILKRYENSSWHALETHLLKEDDEYFYYESVSNRLSLYIITIAEPIKQELEKEEEPKKDEPEEEDITPINLTEIVRQIPYLDVVMVLAITAVLAMLVASFIFNLKKGNLKFVRKKKQQIRGAQRKKGKQEKGKPDELVVPTPPKNMDRYVIKDKVPRPSEEKHMRPSLKEKVRKSKSKKRKNKK